MVRSLGDIVKKEAFINDSEYLMTAMVVVPKYVSRNKRGNVGILWDALKSRTM